MTSPGVILLSLLLMAVGFLLGWSAHRDWPRDGRRQITVTADTTKAEARLASLQRQSALPTEADLDFLLVFRGASFGPDFRMTLPSGCVLTGSELALLVEDATETPAKPEDGKP